MFDLLIRGATVVAPGGTTPLDVAVADGRIAALFAPGTPAGAARTLDAGGRHLLPGAIDIHVHVRAPAHPERATVASETRAAAAGGITTLFEMPITRPCCATAALVDQRRRHFEQEALVNFAFYGAPGVLDEAGIEAMLEAGVIGFKLFMTAAPPGREDEFTGLALPDEADLLRTLRRIADSGRTTVVHAESQELLERLPETPPGQAGGDAAAYSRSRPPVTEAVAIAKLLALNEAAGARLHIAHVSSRAGAQALRLQRRAGMDVSGETCPHYLLCTEADLLRHGAFAKIAPPLRTPDDQSALWEAIGDGTITHLASDHSPFSAAEKAASPDIMRAPPGVPGLEQLVLTGLDAVAAGRIGLEQAVDLLCTNPARRFGLFPHKGVIAPGADADLVLVELDGETTIRPESLYTAARACERLYAGRRFRGRIETTLVNGRIVCHQGEILGVPGDGRFVAGNGASDRTRPAPHPTDTPLATDPAAMSGSAGPFQGRSPSHDNGWRPRS